MKLRVFTSMSNGVYRVSVHTEDWSEGDRDLMAKYGEPTVNIGGTVNPDYYDDLPPITLPDSFSRVMSDAPMSVKFDSRDYGEGASFYAQAWTAGIVTSITDEVTILRQNVDNFSKEEVVTV